MLRINNLLYLSIILLLVSCKHSNYKEENTKYGKKIAYNLIDNIALFDSAFSFRVSLSSNIKQTQDDFFVCFYSEFDSGIYVYNIDQQKFLQKNNISSLINIDSFGSIQSIYLHNEDSIFIQQDYKISLLSENKIKTNWNINHIEDTLNEDCIFPLDANPFYFDWHNKQLVLQHYNCMCYFDSVRFFSSSPIVYLNTLNENITTPNIRYSYLYDDGYYGFKNKIFIRHDDENTYLSYLIDPNIYIVNHKTKTQKIVGGKSKFQKRSAINLGNDMMGRNDKKMEDLRTDFWYHEIIPDTKRRLYYRFFGKEMPLKNEKNKLNKLEEKEYSLMVFNDNFEVIDEIEFPEKILPILYISNKGIYVVKFNRNNKNKIPKYYLIQFN